MTLRSRTLPLFALTRGLALGTALVLASCSHPPTHRTPSSDPVPADILSAEFKFECSPDKEIGCKGIFNPHSAETSQVGLLTNGEASLTARLQTLIHAKKSIRIQALVFKADESGRAIAELLKKRKIRDHLDIRVIVDAFSNLIDPEKHRLDFDTQKMYYDLKQNGIEVEGYETGPLVWLNEVSLQNLKQPDQRFHEKLWIVDAELKDEAVAIMGGMNIANEYFRMGADSAHLWRDQDFILKGEVIQDLTKAFDRNYQDQKKIKSSHGVFDTDKSWALWRKKVITKTGKLRFEYPENSISFDKLHKLVPQVRFHIIQTLPTQVRFIQNRPRYKESFIKQAYSAVFDSAEKEILIENAYFIPSDAMIKSLTSAARRGVHVTILTNSPQTNDLPQMAIASRYLYKDLLAINDEPETRRNGGLLQVAEWNGTLFGEGTLHAKFAVIDRKRIIGGSYNLDRRSEDLNSETVIVLENETLASNLADQVTVTDLAKSKIFTAQEVEVFHNPTTHPDFLQLLLWNGLKGEL